MKDEFKKTFKRDFPDKLHNSIMKQVVYLKFRNVIFLVAGILILNFLASGWYLWLKVTEINLIDLLRIASEDLEADSTVIRGFIQTVIDYMPFAFLALFLFSLFLVLWFLYTFWRLKHNDEYFQKAVLKRIK